MGGLFDTLVDGQNTVRNKVFPFLGDNYQRLLGGKGRGIFSSQGRGIFSSQFALYDIELTLYCIYVIYVRILILIYRKLIHWFFGVFTVSH